ncbi:MAG: linear amide C-N hydrolase [Chloroflexota bacterium]
MLKNMLHIAGLLVIGLLVIACQHNPPTVATQEGTFPEGMSAEDATSLRSLERVDEYPLYTMNLSGDYQRSSNHPTGQLPVSQPENSSESIAAWGCSLFAAFADPKAMLYGRNFDWEYSPALLLFARPATGYASVSMVDLAYLGFTQEQLAALDETPLAERTALLQAPFLPFDGMNDQGLVIGMAAVSPGNVPDDPNKPTIGSLGIMRGILDNAANVAEALKIMQGYNIDFTGGPPVHYLIADAGQHAALVEFSGGKMVVIENEGNWHAATNFLVSETGGNPAGLCNRYDLITQHLSSAQSLTTQDALALLKSVSQSSTQWSMVYDYSQHTVQVAMGRDYNTVHTFSLDK